jgi:hypothetical protein
MLRRGVVLVAVGLVLGVGVVSGGAARPVRASFVARPSNLGVPYFDAALRRRSVG